MVSFKQAKDMFRMQREAKRVKRELKNIHVEAEASASTPLGTGSVKVVVAADQEIVSIEIPPGIAHEQIGPLLKDALNRAMKKVQVISAEKMQPMMEEMGMPTG